MAVGVHSSDIHIGIEIFLPQSKGERNVQIHEIMSERLECTSDNIRVAVWT